VRAVGAIGAVAVKIAVVVQSQGLTASAPIHSMVAIRARILTAPRSRQVATTIIALGIVWAVGAIGEVAVKIAVAAQSQGLTASPPIKHMVAIRAQNPMATRSRQVATTIIALGIVWAVGALMAVAVKVAVAAHNQGLTASPPTQHMVAMRAQNPMAPHLRGIATATHALGIVWAVGALGAVAVTLAVVAHSQGPTASPPTQHTVEMRAQNPTVTHSRGVATTKRARRPLPRPLRLPQQPPQPQPQQSHQNITARCPLTTGYRVAPLTAS